jgi:hypothetical protein
MHLYRSRDGVSLLDYQEMIPEGGCDRAFYAQVADGNIYRVPKGFGERILQASGLKSRAQLQQYRALLDVPDEVWMQADEEDWPEGRIREYMNPHARKDTSTTVDISPKTDDRLTMVNLSPKKVQSQPSPELDSDILFEPPVDKFLKLLQRDKAKARAFVEQARSWIDAIEAQYLWDADDA